MHPDQSRGLRACVLAYIIWGLLTIYWKQLSAFDALELIGYRIVAASVILAALITAQHRWPALVRVARNPKLVRRIAWASVLLTVNWTTYVFAVVTGHVIETALGYFFSPLVTMAIGILVLGETLTPLKRLGIVAALASVTVLTLSYGQIPWIALLIAGSWGWYGLTKRKVPLPPVESLSSELFVLLVPALGVIAWGATRNDGVPALATRIDLVLIAGTGLITAVPLLLFAFAAQRVPFTLLGPLNYLVPMINLVLGWAVYDEEITASRFAGIVLVWIALALITLDAVKRSGRKLPPAGAREQPRWTRSATPHQETS